VCPSIEMYVCHCMNTTSQCCVAKYFRYNAMFSQFTADHVSNEIMKFGHAVSCLKTTAIVNIIVNACFL